MSQSASSSKFTGSQPRRSWLFYSMWAIGIVVCLLVTLFLFVLIGGSVSGREFSPQTFSVRSFNYTRLPFFNWQLTKTQVNSLGGSLACSVNITKNIPGAIQGTPRWDLIIYSVSGREFPPGDAAILMEYLQANDENGLATWDMWTIENPSLAAVLWPAIQQLAIHQCYFAIPDIMQLAAANPTPSELSAHITTVCQSSAIVRAEKFIAEGESEQAKALLEWSLSFGPSDKLEALRKSIDRPSSGSTSATDKPAT